ncbi:hypothetical protein PHMEG_00017811, partial [Phytophthora megakarya]
QNRPTPLTFDHNLHRRAGTPLWRIAVSYTALQEDHLIAYCKSIHYLEITEGMLNSDPDLFVYHQDRCQRRISIGDHWQKLLGAYLPMMRSQAAKPAWSTANIPEPSDLITAMFECDQADPWRNHYRDPDSAHQSLQIPRLTNKFNPPAAPCSWI